jgi:hypothetical protein
MSARVKIACHEGLARRRIKGTFRLPVTNRFRIAAALIAGIAEGLRNYKTSPPAAIASRLSNAWNS